MLDIKELSISIDGRYLIKGLNLTLNKRDKLAIIGEEGNGKSTLLKAIEGLCDYAKVEGIIINKKYRIGYLEQSMSEDDVKKTVYQYLFKDSHDYYDKVSNLYKWLDDLKLDDSLLDRTTKTLSGGEKVKVGLLKLLIDDSDILLLDEPTNDLDIETLKWLEDFINGSDKPIMYVSHDETLLSHTANIILHMEQIKKKTECRHTLLKTDYDSYVDSRLRKLAHQTQQARADKREFKKQQEKLYRIMQKVEYKQNTISRADPHGAQVLKKKMHALKSQERRLDKIELTELPDVEESINMFFEDIDIPKTKKIVDVDIPVLKIANKLLVRNIKLDVYGCEHICIIGKNGAGKSTLLKELYAELKERTDIKVGYMPQDYNDVLKEYTCVLDYICPDRSKESIAKSRTMLSSMNITQDEALGKISDLSNGTKAKVLIAKLILDKSEVLLLDEPTRNVSPLSNPIIRSSLKEFKGAIISISHDRKYIEEVADKIYLLTENGLVVI